MEINESGCDVRDSFLSQRFFAELHRVEIFFLPLVLLMILNLVALIERCSTALLRFFFKLPLSL